MDLCHINSNIIIMHHHASSSIIIHHHPSSFIIIHHSSSSSSSSIIIHHSSSSSSSSIIIHHSSFILLLILILLMIYPDPDHHDHHDHDWIAIAPASMQPRLTGASTNRMVLSWENQELKHYNPSQQRLSCAPRCTPLATCLRQNQCKWMSLIPSNHKFI